MIVSFLDMFTGTIDSLNLSRPTPVHDIHKVYERGSVQLARVVFVDHGTKEVRLSLRPHVVEFRSESEDMNSFFNLLLTFYQKYKRCPSHKSFYFNLLYASFFTSIFPYPLFTLCYYLNMCTTHYFFNFLISIELRKI